MGFFSVKLQGNVNVRFCMFNLNLELENCPPSLAYRMCDGQRISNFQFSSGESIIGTRKLST